MTTTEFEIRRDEYATAEAVAGNTIVDIQGNHVYVMFLGGYTTDEFSVPLDQTWMLEGSPLGRAIQALREVGQ